MTTESMNFLTNVEINENDLTGDIATEKVKSTKTNEITINVENINNNLVSTLDEPVSVTIMRDLKAVGYKFGHVFYPKTSTLLLKDWDLWGPLFLTVILAVSLQGNQDVNNSAPEFANLFALVALGSILVTINAKLLSGKISFFQSICILGYCLLPLVVVSIINNLIVWMTNSSSILIFILRCLLVFTSFGWSLFASTAFLASSTTNLADRKVLALYPIFLFYFIISWLIILHTN
jgi:protein YIPF6